jgi:phthalate 4,5-cis-dihydrodiol dehydrogenase
MTVPEYLRWGIIGLGSGASNLLSGFAHNPHVRVVAACDVRVDALAAFGKEYGVPTYGSVEELCQSPEVDAVWVATPNHLHASHAITAVNRGKHVTVSKPMGITLAECEAMNDAADRNGVVLLCGHTQAMLPPIRKLAELVWSGAYGKLGMILSANYNDWIYRPRMPHELDVAQGGGAVYRQSPHHIDIVRLIGGGLVKSVRAQMLQLDPRRPAPGAFTAYLEFQDGTPATIVFSGYGHFTTTELTGSRRFAPPTVTQDTTLEQEQALKEQMRYTGSDASREQDETGVHPVFGLNIVTCERADIRPSKRGVLVYDRSGAHEIVVPRDRYRGEAEFEEMYQTVVNGRPVIHTGRWGEATHEVTLAIMESARTGREVFLTHQVGLPAALPTPS